MTDHAAKGLTHARAIARERFEKPLAGQLNSVRLQEVGATVERITEHTTEMLTVLDYLVSLAPKAPDDYLSALTSLNNLLNKGEQPDSAHMRSLSRLVLREEMKLSAQCRELKDQMLISDKDFINLSISNHAKMGIIYLQHSGENSYGLPEEVCEKMKQWDQWKVPYIRDPEKSYTAEEQEAIAGRMKELCDMALANSVFHREHLPDSDYCPSIRNSVQRQLVATQAEAELLGYCNESLSQMAKALNIGHMPQPISSARSRISPN